MRYAYGVPPMTLLFAACGPDKGPTVSAIEEGYRNLTAQNLTRAVADFGSEDEIPPVILSMLKMTTEVDSPKCEKNRNDLGYICLYNITLINQAGVSLDPVTDIKARVGQVDAGWMVEEIAE